jgi:hypothetical protein
VSGSYSGITVDRISDAADGGLGFMGVSFFDVISGDFLTITGEATI